MVCDRCIASVQSVLADLGYEVDLVVLGKANISEDPDEKELAKIASQLSKKGFELIRDNDKALVEDIKTRLISYLNHIEEQENPEKLSTFLENELEYNYSYLSKYFSDHAGITIEKYLINLKIERVKELLTYQEMTLSEIAWKLNYSSVQYLSNQFKKVTGQTVSSFRNHLDEANRRSLDSIQN